MKVVGLLLPLALALVAQVASAPLSSQNGPALPIVQPRAVTLAPINTTGPTEGWTDSVSHEDSIYQEWPIDEDGLTYIRWCYEFADMDTQASRWFVDGAITMWGRALGQAGRHNGHRLLFKQVAKGCRYKDPNTGREEWDDNVEHDTLVISDTPMHGSHPHGTMGYLGIEYSGEPGRHHINFNHRSLNQDQVYLIAHEIGHVLGLEHEHQRPDRDNYIYFQCDKLYTYDEYKHSIEEGGETMARACEYPDVAEEFGWVAGEEYGKGDRTDNLGSAPIKRTYSQYYDKASIMHYSSYQGAKRGASKKLDYPIVAWKSGVKPHANPTEDEVEMIPDNRQITSLDADAVKRLYPFIWD